MAGIEGGKRPGRYEAAFNAGRPGGGERYIPPHEQLVTAIKETLAREREQAQREVRHVFHPLIHLSLSLNDEVNNSYLPGEYPSARYLFFEGLRDAWDALSYDHLPESERGNKQSRARSLRYYLEGTNVVWKEDRPYFVLKDEAQVALLDAMAEAVDIPHERGQNLIPFPASLSVDGNETAQ